MNSKQILIPIFWTLAFFIAVVLLWPGFKPVSLRQEPSIRIQESKAKEPQYGTLSYEIYKSGTLSVRFYQLTTVRSGYQNKFLIFKDNGTMQVVPLLKAYEERE